MAGSLSYIIISILPEHYFLNYRIHSCSILIKCLLITIQTALKMNNKIAVILALADVKYSLNDLEKHYKTFCGLYMALKKRP